MECASPDGSLISWSCAHLTLSFLARRFALFRLDFAVGCQCFQCCVRNPRACSARFRLPKGLFRCLLHGLRPAVIAIDRLIRGRRRVRRSGIRSLLALQRFALLS